MPIQEPRFRALHLVSFILLALMLAGAQTNPDQKNDQKNNDRQNNRENEVTNPPTPGAEYSGTYSFLRDGEFVQITVEDQGTVTGFVSRYGDSDGDRDVFLDHFFKSGKLDGNRLTFTTDTVQGVWFEFRGTIERGDGKNRNDEAYSILKGTLIETTTGEAKKTSSRSVEVALKSFPRDAAPLLPAGK
jgi:hypothetical protein